MENWRLNPCRCNKFKRHLRLLGSGKEQRYEIFSKASGFTIIFRLYTAGDMTERTADNLRVEIANQNLSRQLTPLSEKEVEFMVDRLEHKSLERCAELLDFQVEWEMMTFADADKILDRLNHLQMMREMIKEVMHLPPRPCPSAMVM